MSNTNTESDIIIKSISNETRRNIVRLLYGQTMTYSEMAHLLNFDLKTESGKFNFHLKELVNAALVVSEQEQYQLTDKGEEIYYLLVDIERDREIDPHGLMTALIRLEGRKEFFVFLAALVIVASLQGLLIGAVALLGLGNYVGLKIYGAALLLLSGIGLFQSIRYYMHTVNALLGNRSTSSKAISTLFFLNIQWYFIRVKNRMTYFLASIFGLLGWIFSIMAGLFGLSQLGGVEDFGGALNYFIGIALGSLLLGLYFLIRLFIMAKNTDTTEQEA